MTYIYIPITPMRIVQCRVAGAFVFTFNRSVDPVACVFRLAIVVQS